MKARPTSKAKQKLKHKRARADPPDRPMRRERFQTALKGTPRLWILRLLLLIGILALLPAAFRDFKPLPQDFIAYWSAGRLSLGGENPYSLSRMLTVQREAGWTAEAPLMVWYPPWTLVLFLPFGILPFKAGWLAWFLLDLGLVIACSDWLWQRYGGPVKLRWLAWLSALLTSYTLYALTFTQATPLMLLGLVLFLQAIEDKPQLNRRMVFLTWGKTLGAGLLLVSIKPQALYLFWIVLGIWVLRRKRLDVALVGGFSLLAASALSTAFNPNVWGEYLGVLREYPPDFWGTPTIGFLLRQVFGWEQTWTLLPGMVLGAGWFAWRWHRGGKTWAWADELPLLTAISLMTAPHTWTHDQVLLVPAQMAVAAGLVRGGWSTAATRLALAWFGLQALSFVLHYWVSDAWFFWQAPAIAGLYWVGMRIVRRSTG